MPPFPFDLIEEVLAYCADTTLASCALTSRDVLELSRGLLYKSLRVSEGYIHDAPDDIGTTSSHLLRYARHLDVNVVAYFRSPHTMEDVIVLFQRLVYYGNLNAICISFEKSPYSGRHQYIHYLRHFVPLLQMESVKYVHAPVIAICTGTGDRIGDALFSSSASLDLTLDMGDTIPNSPYDYPTPIFNKPYLISNKPYVTTLTIPFGPVRSGGREAWNWFTSHISLSQLTRLSIYIEQTHTSIIREFSSSLPESLSELSIFITYQEELASTSKIERFHSLRNLSFFSLLYNQENVVDFLTINIIKLLECISPSSRRSLDRINIYVALMHEPV